MKFVRKTNKKLFFLCLLIKALILFCGCKDEFFAREKTIESEGVKVKINACLNKDFDAGIAGGGHSGIILPLVGVTKDLSVEITPEGRNSFYAFNDHSGIFGIVRKKDLDELFGGVNVMFAPNHQHLLYLNKAKGYEDTIVIHYLEKKFPFTSSYYEKRILNNGAAQWTILPDEKTLALKMIADTSILNPPDHRLFWAALNELPAENEYDFELLKVCQFKEGAYGRIYTITKEWKSRSKKWKQDFRMAFIKMMETKKENDLSNTNYFSSFRDLAFECGDKEMRAKYTAYAVNNFVTRELSDISLSDTAETFFRRHQQTLCKKSFEIIKKGDVYEVADVLRLSDNFTDGEIKKQCLALMVSKWPQIPQGGAGFGTVIDDYFDELSKEQKNYLKNKALHEIENKSNREYEAFNFLGKHLPCPEVRALEKKYPGKIDAGNFDCATYTDSTGKAYYMDRKAEKDF